ncbi:hypothetical protein [Burkholderia sp. Ac-20379]|uniref:hypothetical protein n=1 Tax=Burkholderia sp. Ac-20379 TaxID=2703900 RepID=UPI00197DE776|nr:hypothetical protein [Burkholderia sp. Ac-20379]MBN3727266.1 hypothetical protein [Burkholderia sp. Ac-20379]
MTSESLSRRKFIKWAVSSFVLTKAAASRKILEAHAQTTESNVEAWTNLSIEQRARTLFSRQLPASMRLVAAAGGVGVVAAIFETETGSSGVAEIMRWLCIASERSQGTHAIQVTADAMATSTSFHPVDVSLSVLDDGSIDVSEQHLRSHTQHVWKELDGKWCLAKQSFAGNVAHRFVTRNYDIATEKFVTTTSLIESNEVLAMECVSVDALITLGTYCNGQAIV